MIGVKKKTCGKLELERLLAKGSELPRHVAIIMDGNGRWAKKRMLPRAAGHREGVRSVKTIVETAGALNIKYLTLYTFSKENWERPVGEVSTLMKLLASSLRKELQELVEKNVRLKTIGDLEDLPGRVRDELLHAMDVTAHNTGLTLNLALSYGGRSEILNAARELARKVRDGELFLNDLDDEHFADALYTKDIPDPDLLIRTSGEQRISNFLLWQLAYSEIYITGTFWPDFREQEFYESLINYMRRERRYGKTSEQLNGHYSAHLSNGHESNGQVISQAKTSL